MHLAHHELERDFITIIINTVIVIFIVTVIAIAIAIVIVIVIVIVTVIVIVIIIVTVIVLLLNTSVYYRVWRSEGCLEDWREGQAEAFGQRFQCKETNIRDTGVLLHLR